MGYSFLGIITIFIKLICLISNKSYCKNSSKDFDLNVFSEINSNKLNDNILISPLSLKSALAMVYEG